MYRVAAALALITVFCMPMAACGAPAAAGDAQPILPYPTAPATPTLGQPPAHAASALASASSLALSPTDLLARWQVVDFPPALHGEGGRWIIRDRDGYLAQDGVQPSGLRSAAETALLAPAPLGDGAIQVTFADANNGTVGLIARSSDAGFYRARIFADPSWDGVALALDRVGTDGAATALVTVMAAPLYTRDAWHTLALTVAGDQLRVTLDGQVVATATDMAPLPAGRPGILARALGGLVVAQVQLTEGE